MKFQILFPVLTVVLALVGLCDPEQAHGYGKAGVQFQKVRYTPAPQRVIIKEVQQPQRVIIKETVRTEQFYQPPQQQLFLEQQEGYCPPQQFQQPQFQSHGSYGGNGSLSIQINEQRKKGLLGFGLLGGRRQKQTQVNISGY